MGWWRNLPHFGQGSKRYTSYMGTSCIHESGLMFVVWNHTSYLSIFQCKTCRSLDGCKTTCHGKTPHSVQNLKPQTFLYHINLTRCVDYTQCTRLYTAPHNIHCVVEDIRLSLSSGLDKSCGAVATPRAQQGPCEPNKGFASKFVEQ